MSAYRYLFILVLLLGVSLAELSASPNSYRQAQHRTASDVSYKMRYRGSLTLGYLNKDDKINFYINRPVVLGGTFAVEFLPTGRWKCMQAWNNASVGLALSFYDLGHNKFLGQVIAPHAYINVPLYRHPRVIVGLRPGLGLAFSTRTYQNTVPKEYLWQRYRLDDGTQIANASIGSYTNAFLKGELYLDFPFGKNWDVTLSLGWQHLSNGSTVTPNSGYNMFNAEIGVAYTPTRKTQGFRYYEPDPMQHDRMYAGVKKIWGIELMMGGGVRSVYYKDRRWYGAASLSLSAYWQPLAFFRVGLGADMFYDGAFSAVYYKFAKKDEKNITYFSKTYISENKVANCFRAGISVQPEFVFGNLVFGYHIGVYLYDPIKNLEPFNEVESRKGKPFNRGIFYAYNPMLTGTKQDGWLYQKLQLRYYCSEHFFINLGLKAHFFKAEFIDVGMGFRFN